MEKYYTEKALLATEYKIQTLKKRTNLILKNNIKITLFGIIFSFVAPFYSNSDYLRNHPSVLENSLKEGIGYWELVIYILIGYSGCCILLHYLWKYQDNKELNNLFSTKQQLEKEIEKLNEF